MFFDIKKICFQSQMWCISIHIKLDQRNKSRYLKNPDDRGLDNQSLIVINCRLCGHKASLYITVYLPRRYIGTWRKSPDNQEYEY